MKRESKLKCCGLDNEVTCQQLLWFSSYGLEIKNLSDEETQAAISDKTHKVLGFITDHIL